MPHCHVDQGRELALNTLERSRQQFATRDDHDIEPARGDTEPEDLAHPALCQISINSPAELLARGNANARLPLAPEEPEDRHQPAMLLDAPGEDPYELTAPP